MKDFFLSVECAELKDNKIFDLSVYKPGNLRIYGTSKINKNNMLKVHSTNNYKYVNEYTFFLDTLLKHTKNIKVLNYQPVQTITASTSIQKNKRIINKLNNKNKLDECNDLPLEDIEKYLDLISTNRAKNYDSWILVGMTLNNCNSDSLDLWMRWSRKVEEYSKVHDSNYINKWNEFKIYNNGISSLKYMAKEDNPEKFREIDYAIEKDNFSTIDFNKEYLLMENDKKDDIMKTNLDKFINDKNIKTLCIKSPYNTGKSTLLKNILSDKYERILFVTYRKTLTNNIHGTFDGFYSYLDKKYKADKIICQLDSLDNLVGAYINDYNDEFPTYDLVILDECESTLNHFSAKILDNSYEIYDILKNIIRNSNKLICLDGDLSNRTYDFIKDFGQNIILRNTIIKDKKHFIFRKNKDKFDELIKNDLEKKLNLCIVSMSSKVAESIYNTYKDIYKCCIHTGNGDDSNLEKLKDVNDYWKKFQLIIYSPTIESGVSFDIENHVNKIYGILSIKSTSQRAFMQMLSRCRKIKDNNINILLNDLPYYENACYYTFNETRDYVISLYQNFLKKEIVTENNKVKVKYVYDEYVNNLVYNKQEELNKNSPLFVPYLIQLMKNKGHTYEYINDDLSKKTKEKKIDDGTIEEIYYSKSVNKSEAGIHLNAKLGGVVTREDKMIIEKFMFKNIWKIDYFDCDIDEDIDTSNKKIIDLEFFKKYSRNTYILNNLRTLINDTKIDIYDDREEYLLINFRKAEFLSKKEMIKNIIAKLGFNLNDMSILLDKETFTTNLEVISTDKQFFGSEKNKILFGFNKNTNKTIKSYMGFLNSVLKNWGLAIEFVDKKNKINKKIIHYKNYKLSYNDLYNNFL